MAENEKTLQFEFIVLESNGQGAQKRITSLVDDDGNAFDLESLKKSILNVLKENEDYVKKIWSFAGGLTQDYYKASGFVLGWIAKAAIATHESKNNIKLRIKLDETKITEEELRLYALEQLKSMVKFLEENSDLKLSKMPGSISDDFADLNKIK